MLSRRETAEVQLWEEFKVLKGSVIVETKLEALRIAREWSDRLCTVWIDGLRRDDGAVGEAAAFWGDGG